MLSREDELGKEYTYEKINHHYPRTYHDTIRHTETGRRTTARDRRKNATDGDNGAGEQVPEESETTTETALVDNVSEKETESETEETAVSKNEATPMEAEVSTVETPTFQETPKEESAEITEETIITEPDEETVECIDESDQNLAEYKPQIGGQPNPFENDTPTEIDDRPVEDYVGEDEDRPGEGKHF